MLKKINVSGVRIGMYVQEVCGSWLEHPFWKKSFHLSQAEQLKKLQECGLHEVWIDTDKGLDVDAETRVVTEAEEREQVDGVLQQAAVYEPRELSPIVALHEEIDHARKIHAKAKTAAMYMFHNMRLGKITQAEDAFALVEDISQTLMRNSNAFLCLARMKDKDNHTYLHSLAVCALMMAVGRQFGIEGEALRNLGVAGLLHDTGMTRIPDRILNKTRSLTDEEFKVIKAHPQIGWKMLKGASGIDDIVLDVCLNHHERTDGTGYPGQLSETSISLYSKICTVCDVYDTISSDRCYKKGYAPMDAIRKMAAWQSGHFDEQVFHAFVKTLGIYPAGTLVKLKSGRLAVVTDQAAKSLLTPIVKVFYSTNIDAPIFPELLDLSRGSDSISSVESPAKWGLNLRMVTGF